MGKKKLVEYAVSVRKREADATLPQGFYDLQPKAGMVVAKLRNQDEGEPEKRTSTVDLFKTTEDGDLVAIGTMNDAPRPLSWVRPLIAVTLMVLAGLAYPWRSRKPKSPSTNPGV